ncbi:hypothetical protein [Streptomyces sirii]|uniref:hypothetical protein n=1 Tax=Streptomyces sirii TaxID=3127701 RepID=UPI003D35B7AF
MAGQIEHPKAAFGAYKPRNQGSQALVLTVTGVYGTVLRPVTARDEFLRILDRRDNEPRALAAPRLITPPGSSGIVTFSSGRASTWRRTSRAARRSGVMASPVSSPAVSVRFEVAADLDATVGPLEHRSPHMTTGWGQDGPDRSCAKARAATIRGLLALFGFSPRVRPMLPLQGR